MGSAYTAAAYARASKDESGGNTIDNQIDMIFNHVKSTPGVRIASVRKDSGYSGVNFARPAFNEMMNDIGAGRINCVIVKDLSRLGRNYLEVGEYMDKIFPLYNVRLIAINDGYDSINPRSDADEILLPFKNILNEQYLRDFSKKIRSSLDVKRKNGEFVNAFAPYGYKRDERNKHRLAVDGAAATVVREIYRLKIEGVSQQKIAVILNEAEEPSPADYKKRSTNYVGTFRANEKTLWTAASVGRILVNPVYTGVLMQGRYTTLNYKVKKRVERPKRDWQIIQNAHQPIITALEFETVSRLLKQDNRAGNEKGVIYPLSGYVYCAGCGDSMVRQRAGKLIYFVCASSRNGGGCSSHCIQVKKLENAVLDVITRQAALFIGIEEALKAAGILSVRQKEDVMGLNKRITARETEITACEQFRGYLYEDYKSGVITGDDYIKFNKAYQTRIDELSRAAEKLREENRLLIETDSSEPQWFERVWQYRDLTKLTRGAVVSFIERIEIFCKNRVLIKLRYREPLFQGITNAQNE